MYSAIKKLGYHNVDDKGYLTLCSIMNSLQSIGGFFAEEKGFGEKYLFDNNIGWIVYNWNIEIFKLPNIRETASVIVKTGIYNFSGSIVERYYEICDMQNKPLIKGFATWVLISMENMLPTRLNDNIKEIAKRGKEELSLEMDEPCIRKIEKCLIKNIENFKDAFHSYVFKSYIDIRGHMNNARYLELIMEIADIKDFSKLLITYNKSLAYKEEFTIKKLEDENGLNIVFVTMDKNKEVINCSIRLCK